MQNCDFKFVFDLAESKVAVFLCSILTSDGVPFCFWEKLVSLTIQPFRLLHVFYIHNQSYKNVTIDSDFIWDFGKLPFPTHLGKYFIKIGKIRAKIHEIGKIKAIFGLGMTPIYGLKNGQIKSLIDFVIMTQSMQSVISCSCCCFSAHRSHFACFSRARGDDVFVIIFGC